MGWPRRMPTPPANKKHHGKENKVSRLNHMSTVINTNYKYTVTLKTSTLWLSLDMFFENLTIPKRRQQMAKNYLCHCGIPQKPKPFGRMWSRTPAFPPSRRGPWATALLSTLGWRGGRAGSLARRGALSRLGAGSFERINQVKRSVRSQWIKPAWVFIKLLLTQFEIWQFVQIGLIHY